MNGRVIQGFFVGGRMPPAGAAARGIAQRATAAPPGRPGPPAPAFAPRSAVQARAAPGRPALVCQPATAFANSDGFPIDPVQIGLARGGGAPLPQALLAKMEAAFGTDFSAVRVHVGPQAARIGAIAFTTGNDLYFAPGQFQPDTVKGQQLIGHELAHVIQQRQGRVRAPGAGVAVVQDRMLEAEADRLGMRAAAHRAPLPGPARGSVQRASVPWRSPLQRMQVDFPIEDPAPALFTTFGNQHQSDLEGKSKKRGRKSHRGAKDLTKAKRRKIVYAGGTDSHGKTHSAGVVSYIKFNGKILTFGENEKADENIVFHSMGYKNQRGIKDNPHAEDWSIQAFKSRYEAAKSQYNDMDDWLNAIGHPSTGNTGQGGRHVISILINYSSCLGCVTTIREFHRYLEAHLGPGQFLLRVKFLRPYDLAQTLKDRKSQAARNFISGIGGLREKGIFVRMQSEQSAERLLGVTPDSGVLETIAVNHPGVKKVLTLEQYNYLTLTWTALGANRKGVLSTTLPVVPNTSVNAPPPVTGFHFTPTITLPPPTFHTGVTVPSTTGSQTAHRCNAPTKTGRCTRMTIRTRCWQHR